MNEEAVHVDGSKKGEVRYVATVTWLIGVNPHCVPSQVGGLVGEHKFKLVISRKDPCPGSH